ncbi:MAG: hypothetical protein WDA22_12675 [Bacteroidota bacterium]
MNRTAEQRSTSSPIEDKVANILAYTKNFAHAAVAQNDDDKVVSMLRFAENFALNGNFESAFIHIQRAYNVSPSHPNIPLMEKKLHDLNKNSSAHIRNVTAMNEMSTPSSHAFSIQEYVAHLHLEHESKEIQELLSRAEYYREQNEIAQAKKAISRAYEIDPLNDSIHKIEQRLCVEDIDTDHTIRSIVLHAYQQLKEKDYDGVLVSLQQAYEIDPLNERILSIEGALEISAKNNLSPVEEHLLAAHRYYGSNEYDKAIMEVRLGYLLDPFNEQLSKLEARIEIAQQKK